ncbi:MAG: hypothetical protein ABSB01_26055 [Streptosporangiaceae bacterium]|jgi:hypothetical protein
MKIDTLKVSALFTEDGYQVEDEVFDTGPVRDGRGQALLKYDNGSWELRTPEEEVDRDGNDVGSHGYMKHKDVAEAVGEARRLLRGKNYKVTFKLNAEDPD